MRQSIALAATIAVVGLGLAVLANEKPPAEFQSAMKENGATLGKMAKDAEGKDYDAIAADAAVLKRNFMGTVGKYFTNAKNDEAVKLCTAAYQASDTLEQAAKSKSDMDVATARKSVQSACGACHMVWREQLPDKSFEIKTK
jgi:cytochrome c556